MDFTSIDRVIELLQKKVDSGSPPVVFRGTLGIWRTIRGFRTFLEIRPGAGRYNFNGKSYKGGRVLVGPPSLTGKDIGNIPQDVWSALTGTGTRKRFDIASEAGKQALKESITNSLGDDDTRHKKLAETGDLVELVQIARSAGFTDAEIEDALKGKVFQNALPREDDEADSVKTLPQKKPSKDSPSSSGKATATGEYAPIMEAVEREHLDSESKRKELIALFEASAEKAKDDLYRKNLMTLASGLKTGDTSVEEALSELKSVTENKLNSVYNRLSEKDRERLRDKAVAQPVVQEIRNVVEDSEKKPFSPQAEALTNEIIIKKLDYLADRLENQAVRTQVTRLRRQVSKRQIGGRSALLQLLRILNLILNVTM